MDIVAISSAFLLGLIARQFGMPPLVGFLIAGFVLYATGMRITESISEFAEMGVTLLLFSIGLKLRVGSLLMPQIWAVASLHMLVTIILFTTGIYLFGLSGLPLFSDLNLSMTILIAFALSFSSTVFAVKVLEEKSEMSALYGLVSIGILITQDIIAVVFLAVTAGKVPSLWALLLLGLIPLRPALYKIFERAGHGELQILFGLSLAIGGAEIFELVGVKGDLGALILGIMFSAHPKASELSRQLLGFKDLFLVGFFLTIGLSGPLSIEVIGIALLLVVLVPIKGVFFFWLLTRFNLRVRTSLLTSLSLANYSEFGLIVCAVGVVNGWVGNEWLIVIAIALSISFIVAAPLNSKSHQLYTLFRKRLLPFQSTTRIADEEPIDPGDASIYIFGMGRVGASAYDNLRERFGDVVLGIDIDAGTVDDHNSKGRRVILGSATDIDFWDRINMDFNNVNLVMLAMPNLIENLFAINHLKSLNFQGKLAAIAKYPDEIDLLKQAGVDSAFNLYTEAGTGFANHAYQEA
ncbi:MAG: cation:proton antiporter [Gammaproteobacteria bacterium]|nr:cation:proton antiporter [Gammaproteobacteria bacterium]